MLVHAVINSAGNNLYSTDDMTRMQLLKFWFYVSPVDIIFNIIWQKKFVL